MAPSADVHQTENGMRGGRIPGRFASGNALAANGQTAAASGHPVAARSSPGRLPPLAEVARPDYVANLAWPLQSPEHQPRGGTPA